VQFVHGWYVTPRAHVQVRVLRILSRSVRQQVASACGMSILDSVGFALGWCGYTWQKRFFETRGGVYPNTSKEGVTHTAFGCVQNII
jgi:hypothetical protein